MVRRGTIEFARAAARAGRADRAGSRRHDVARVRRACRRSWRAVETTTLAERRKLESLSLDEDDWQRYVAARALPPQPPADARLRACRASARKRMPHESPPCSATWHGKPLDPHELQRRANREYGLDRFESVDYRLVLAGDAERGVEIDLRRKSWGPNFLRLGLGVENDYDGGSRANAAAQLLADRPQCVRRRVAAPGADRRGARLLHRVLPAAVAAQRFLLRAGLRATSSTTLQVIDDGHQVARYRIRETSAAFAVGAELSNWGEVRVGRAARRRQHARAGRRSDVAGGRLRPRRGVPRVRLRPARQRLFSEARDRRSARAGSRTANRSAPASTPTSSRPRGSSRAARTATASCCRSTAARRSMIA